MDCVVADDRPEIASIWTAALSRVGWRGCVTTSAEEARLALAARSPDLAIVDVMLEHGRGPVVADFAADEQAAVMLMADDLTLCSGLPLALAPMGSRVVPRVLTLGEAVGLLRSFESLVPVARLRKIRVPGLNAAPEPPGPAVVPRGKTLASRSCRSGHESRKASRPSHPANRSAPSSSD